MDYEWDEAKRQGNLRKHGLDFMDADLVFEAPVKVTVDAIHPDGDRVADLAEVNGRVLMLVYALRRQTVRCISLRVASRRERKLHDETKNR
ncbi:MAG: BrnT family toxin [Betaproteobacteria bacterium]|nr:BrnT family toxin [Betaproteobacteria bacterium]